MRFEIECDLGRSVCMWSDTSTRFAQQARRPFRLIREPGAASPIGGQAKRCFDVVAAASAILFLLPLICLVALAIKLSDGGPVLYRHRRIGRDGTPFDCLKFRTLATGAQSVF